MSQEISRVILDKNSHTPIPYATIKVLHSNKGEVTSEKGQFVLQIAPVDSVLITCIGYKTRIFLGSELSSLVYMERKTNELSHIFIRQPVSAGKIILGNGKDFINADIKCRYSGEATDNCWPWSPSDKEEFAERISLPDASITYKLTKVFIPTRVKSDYGPLLLKIYAEDSLTGMPGEELFVKLIAVSKKSISKSKVKVDFQSEDIFINGAKTFFLSIGWPPGSSYNKNFTTLIFFLNEEDNTYSRNLVSTSYNWYPFSVMKDANNNIKKATTFYAVELEKLAYQ
jgi:hypothetical protein